jgi:hypothetical protein
VCGLASGTIQGRGVESVLYSSLGLGQYRVSFVHQVLIGLLYQPQMGDEYGIFGEMIIYMEAKVLRENFPQSHYVYRKPNMT